MKRMILLLLAASLLPVSGTAEETLVAGIRTVLEDYAAANPSAPGLAVHVTCPPRGLDRTFVLGNEARSSRRPLTRSHTFRIASNAKTYVAAAVLRLAEEGKLRLDDPLSAHLSPERAALLQGDGYDLDAMTITQVLSHTSGLFEHPADPRYEEAILADPRRVWTPDEVIGYCVEWGDPVAGPAEIFSYSDTGYILLGGIVADLTDENLGRAVNQLLDYDSLGLESTWWELYEARPPGAGRRAHQYYGDLDTYNWHPSLDLYGGGGLITDARELGLFLRLLLEGKVLHDDASLEAMLSEGAEGYRLGLFTTDLAGHPAWGHTGFWNTFAFHVPDLDLTVSGAILDHFAEKGQNLCERLVAAVEETP